MYDRDAPKSWSDWNQRKLTAGIRKEFDGARISRRRRRQRCAQPSGSGGERRASFEERKQRILRWTDIEDRGVVEQIDEGGLFLIEPLDRREEERLVLLIGLPSEPPYCWRLKGDCPFGLKSKALRASNVSSRKSPNALP